MACFIVNTNLSKLNPGLVKNFVGVEEKRAKHVPHTKGTDGQESRVKEPSSKTMDPKASLV